MMRKARTPHEGCGLSSGGTWRRAAAGFACALSCAFLIASMTLLTTGAALAQTSGATGDPFAPANKKKPSSFPKGSMFGKVNTNVDRSQPMRPAGRPADLRQRPEIASSRAATSRSTTTTTF